MIRSIPEKLQNDKHSLKTGIILGPPIQQEKVSPVKCNQKQLLYEEQSFSRERAFLKLRRGTIWLRPAFLTRNCDTRSVFVIAQNGMCISC